MRKYGIGDLSLIAIRVTTLEELQQLEDILYYLIEEWPGEYSKHQLSPIFTVMNGKKTVL